jgi:hypothetical protein
MSLPHELYSVLTACAATDHESAKLLELLTRADEALNRHSLKQRDADDAQVLNRVGQAADL